MRFHLFFLGFVLFQISNTNAQQQTQTATPVQSTFEDQITIKQTNLEEVVVLDSKVELKRSQSGKVTIKITEKELQNYRGRSVSELLQTYSGINIIGSRSSVGQNLNFSIRGGRNRQVLILIDGVRVSDPSRIDNDFDLNFLNLEDITSIEIVKGAVSTLYGSSASAGVINITTKRSSKQLEGSLGITTGTEKAWGKPLENLTYFSSFAKLIGSKDKFNYKINLAAKQVDGLSSVSKGIETDPFKRSNLGVQFGRIGERFSWNTAFNSDNIVSDYDNVFPVEDADFTLKTRLDRLSLTTSYNYHNGSLQTAFGYQKTKRNFKDSFPRSNIASNLTLDLYNRYSIQEKIYSIVGYLYQQSSYVGVPTNIQNDIYANFVYLSPLGINLNIGGRLNINDDYGSHFTYSINPSYSFLLGKKKSRLKFISSYSTAFISPSLYQIYDEYSGNLDLQPEENSTFELGFEWINGVERASLVFFNRQESPTLTYNYTTFRYENSLNKIKYKGIEFEYKNSLFSTVDVRLNYTYNETRGGNLINLPKHSFSSSFDFDLPSNIHLNTSIQHIGSRTSLSGSSLDSYTLVDTKINYWFFNKKISVTLLVTNIFDVEYVEIENFSTRGQNFLLGLNFTY